MTNDTLDIHFPRPHQGQRQVLQDARRFTLLCCGRRWGKDVLLMRRAAKKAARGAPVGWFAPTYKMLSENWRTMNNLLQPVTKARSEQEKRLDLIGGGVLEFWSLDNPDAPRGRKYGHVAINEAAMVRDLEDAWNMVIRPTLADMQGSADFGSTPRGLNYFYTLYQAAPDNPDWSRFHFTTYDNPFMLKSEIDEMVKQLPARVVQQEILAEFVADGSYFQNIDNAATIQAPSQPEEHAGHYKVIGVDWALSNDYTVLTVGCRDCNQVIDWDRFNNIDFTYQRERLYAMAARWGVGGILPERNSIGEPNIEILIQRNLPILPGPDGRPGFNTSATTKPALIQGLATALEHSGFHVPYDYADELRSYEVETMASGHPKFSAPEGQHDDRVISLALCWQGMTSGSLDVF